jgi:hypothetical protein
VTYISELRNSTDSKTEDEDIMGVGLGDKNIILSFTSYLYFQIMYIEAGNLHTPFTDTAASWQKALTFCGEGNIFKQHFFNC